MFADNIYKTFKTFSVSFSRYWDWMDFSGQKQANHKTEIVLIRSRKEVGMITLRVGENELTSQSFIISVGNY